MDSEAVTDVVGLGQAIAADADVAACAAARAYNFAFSKEDIVTDLATVPPSVLDPVVPREGLEWFEGREPPREVILTNSFIEPSRTTATLRPTPKHKETANAR